MAHKIAKAFTSITEILESAMDDEKEAAQFYRDASALTPDPDLKQFLLKLADMEDDHYQSLKAKLDECKAQNFCSEAVLSSFNEN